MVPFCALDHFSREGMLQTVMHLQRLDSYGVKFHSYSEAHLPDNELVRNVLLAVLSSLAKIEAQKISERSKELWVADINPPVGGICFPCHRARGVQPTRDWLGTGQPFAGEPGDRGADHGACASPARARQPDPSFRSRRAVRLGEYTANSTGD